MKKKRFTETQIFSILKEFDAGKNIQDISREHGYLAGIYLVIALITIG